MKILVLGGDGMFGHQLLLSLRGRHDIRVTLRQPLEHYQPFQLFNNNNSYFGVDVRRDEDVLRAIDDFKPDALINAVGLVKQRESAKDAIPNLEINALLPHRLAAICSLRNIRFMHISTDCVFSGRKGRYTERDASDAEDLYGKTKYLGEISSPHSITFRTSFIGMELSRKTSLLEWYLGQRGNIKGFRQAIYSGLTTLEMSRVVENVLINHPELTGVWQVASEPINKYDLLMKLTTLLGRKDVHIEPDDSFVCDRSLNGDAFCQATGFKTPTWNDMLAELVKQIKQRDQAPRLEVVACNA